MESRGTWGRSGPPSPPRRPGSWTARRSPRRSSCARSPASTCSHDQARGPKEATTTATGTLLWISEDQEVRNQDGRVKTGPAPEGARHVVSGEVESLIDPEGPRVTLRREGRPCAVVELPGAPALRVRAHADTACVWAPDGRVVAVDLATRTTVANFTVRTA